MGVAKEAWVDPAITSGLTRLEFRAAVSACQLKNILKVFDSKSRPQRTQSKLPPISASRLAAEHDGSSGTPDTKLYLAYGSNLCHETFQGRRGIRPLAQLNVVVPALRMTFDLPGIPYIEPCFANSALRNPTKPPPFSIDNHRKVKEDEYNKDKWKKGMVGVVYEVTPSDYAHIIATEGGGASYLDILVACHPLTPEDDGEVPEFPRSEAFQAHTLFAPAVPPDDADHHGGRFSRPDPSYAQPSSRYLKLITDGAMEHDIPREYKEYLFNIRPYETRSVRTKMGAFIFEMIWMPFMLFFFALTQKYTGKDGKAPAWLAKLAAIIFGAVWKSYDGIFKPVFGDGERTDYTRGGEREEERNGRRYARNDEEWAEKH